MSEEKKEEVKLSPEQLEVNRKKAIDYYTKQIEILELQARHEKLMSDIEVSRATRLEMIIRQAQMSAGPKEEEVEEREEAVAQVKAPEEESKMRILKKTE